MTAAKDKLETMLEEQVKGLSPHARATKLEAIGLQVAALYKRNNDRRRELFWLERAKEARNEADRLAREDKVAS